MATWDVTLLFFSCAGDAPVTEEEETGWERANTLCVPQLVTGREVTVLTSQEVEEVTVTRVGTTCGTAAAATLLAAPLGVLLLLPLLLLLVMVMGTLGVTAEMVLELDAAEPDETVDAATLARASSLPGEGFGGWGHSSCDDREALPPPLPSLGRSPLSCAEAFLGLSTGMVEDVVVE